VLVSKFANHLPLYHQAQIYARRGVTLDRSKLAGWVGRAAFLLRPVHARLLESLKAASGAAPIRPEWPMSMPPIARPSGRAPISSASRSSSRLMVMAATRCWPSAARFAWPCAGPMCGCGSTNSPMLARRRSPVKRSNALPRSIESKPKSRDRGADERRAGRQDKSLPILEAMQPWLREKLGLISQKIRLAEAILYALSRWEGLSHFVDDGRIEIDSNIVKRAIRPLALTRKNARFTGSDAGAEHWAVIALLIETAKLDGVEPQPRRYHHQDCQRSPQQPHRRTSPVGLSDRTNAQGRGLRTTLTRHPAPRPQDAQPPPAQRPAASPPPCAPRVER